MAKKKPKYDKKKAQRCAGGKKGHRKIVGAVSKSAWTKKRAGKRGIEKSNRPRWPDPK